MGYVNREEIRRRLVGDHDPRDASVHYADEGLIDADDLWWLYEAHRIMAPRDAWLLVGMWADEIPVGLVEEWLELG